jgi:exopolyphosphatase/guanosine-5'-triphosphate,3'-diphosphate pyrophosphatase
VDIDHNYQADYTVFTQVFDFIKTLDPEKKQKLKGISEHSAQTILCGMCVIDAILQYSKLKNIVVGCSYRNLGLMFNCALPYTLERPVADVLGYSLEMITYSAGLNKKHCEQQYNLALMLFKQLKVLHKLPRAYAKVLRIASYLYHLGQKINFQNFERNNYFAILNSPIFGATHKEIVLSAFSAACKRWEDFNLSEWVKYRDMVNEEDLDAVRKISIIIALAEALNIRAQDVVKDISCDILGDSVILKLITDTDVKNLKVDVTAAYMEIFYAKKLSQEFVRAFKKNLEIL